MPIQVFVVPTRKKRIEVAVKPPRWQQYILIEDESLKLQVKQQIS